MFSKSYARKQKGMFLEHTVEWRYYIQNEAI